MFVSSHCNTLIPNHFVGNSPVGQPDLDSSGEGPDDEDSEDEETEEVCFNGFNMALHDFTFLHMYLKKFLYVVFLNPRKLYIFLKISRQISK